MTDKTDKKTDTMTELEQAMAQIKAVYDDGTAIINGRNYVFTNATHKKRLRVFAYFTGIQEELNKGNLSFMGEDEYEVIEKTVSELVTFEDSLLSKLPRHWDKYPDDYILFMTTAMGVISYPFLRGVR